jgi:hypothetical protein
VSSAQEAVSRGANREEREEAESSRERTESFREFQGDLGINTNLSKFPKFIRLPNHNLKQPHDQISYQSGANLPPIKRLGWIGHT